MDCGCISIRLCSLIYTFMQSYLYVYAVLSIRLCSIAIRIDIAI